MGFCLVCLATYSPFGCRFPCGVGLLLVCTLPSICIAPAHCEGTGVNLCAQPGSQPRQGEWGPLCCLSFSPGHRVVAFRACDDVANTCPASYLPVLMDSLSFQKLPHLGQGGGGQGHPSPVGQPVVTKESPESRSGLAGTQRSRAWIGRQVAGSRMLCIRALCWQHASWSCSPSGLVRGGVQMSFQMPGPQCEEHSQGLAKSGAVRKHTCV